MRSENGSGRTRKVARNDMKRVLVNQPCSSHNRGKSRCHFVVCAYRRRLDRVEHLECSLLVHGQSKLCSSEGGHEDLFSLFSHLWDYPDSGYFLVTEAQ